jgi:nicotinate-nucleotide adenylyltransferase
VRLGLFGGTFDPPHLGHLIAAQEAWSALQLDRLLWMPARHPPHKKVEQVSSPRIRVELLEAAVAGDRRFSVSELEVRRPGPSYTVDTLRALREEYPEAGLYLLLGADQYRDLDSWREPEEIRRLAGIGVFARAGEDPRPAAGVTRIRIPRVDISATEIRRRVASGEPIRYLVPLSVERLIVEHGLYAAGTGPERDDAGPHSVEAG